MNIHKICIKYTQNINKMFMLSPHDEHCSYKQCFTFLPLSSRICGDSNF